MANRKLAILSFSGGLDSTTLLYHLIDDGFDVITVSFNYNQINKVELFCKSQLLKEVNSNHDECKVKVSLEVDISNILLMSQEETKLRLGDQNIDFSEYYFPSRNLLFTTLLMNYAETFKIKYPGDYDEVCVALGLQKHSTYEDYWDSNLSFLKAIQNIADLNPANIKVIAPFVNYLKKDVVKRAIELNVPIKKTWTCYNPIQVGPNEFNPCGVCDSCKERYEAGVANNFEKINDYVISVEN